MNQAELDFFNMFDYIRKSNKEEDMFGHYDFVIADNIKVDVKGAKKINRWDKEPNHEIHYVEFQNVRGMKGWLLGKADYIAFENYNTFILVKRDKLKQMCIDNAKSLAILDYKAPYHYYGRFGRNDIMMLVPTIDIKNIASRILYKNQKYPIKHESNYR